MGKARWGRPRPRRGGVLVLRRSAVADTPRRRSLHEQSACGRRLYLIYTGGAALMRAGLSLYKKVRR